MTAPQDPFADPGQQSQTSAGSPQPPPQYGQPDRAQAYGAAPDHGGGGYGPHQSGLRNGFGLTALITGTVGLVFGLLPLTGFWLGVLLGLVAIVFGVLGRGRARRGEATNGGQALAGLICGALALLAGIAYIAAFFIFVGHNLHHCPPGYHNSQGTPETYSTSC